MKVLIDNGHGENTPGKRSPDGRFREYKYNREIAAAVVEHLKLRGYDAELLVPAVDDLIVEFDLESKLMVMSLPDGLLDLN